MITPLRRSGMARVLKGSHSFTCTPSSSADGMNHTCLFQIDVLDLISNLTTTLG